jgi:hypothetical protein
MGSWTTHVRIPVADWRTAPNVDELIMSTERKVRSALRGAAEDPEARVRVWWAAILPAVDPTAHEGVPRGELSMTWHPGELIPAGAEEIVCRGRTVT